MTEGDVASPPVDDETPPPRPADRGVPRGAWLATAGVFTVLAVLGGRYGYHRDELYFIEAGRHPAWGYPDQPPLVPLLAAGWDAITGGHLWPFRLLPALVAASVVPLAAATSAHLGGDRRDRVITAVLTAVTTAVVAMGHLFSTATFDLALTVAVVLLTLRALDSGTPGAWLALGLCAGVAMQVQLLPAVVLACAVAALLLVGPREALRSPWPWLAAVIALVIAAPYLGWQAVHGWPQLAVAADIAAGGSTSSVPRWAILPYQMVMVGPPISPVLVAGARANTQAPALRRFRWLVVAYGLLLVVLLVTGGKPYYATGLMPAVLAAGVPPARRWFTRSTANRVLAGVLVTGHLVMTALTCLPVAPVGSAGFDLAQAVNPDTGESVGWDRFTATAVGAITRLEATRPAPAAAAFLTGNYGEAGALDQWRREHPGTPWRVYSGHNGYGEWGPPPDTVQAVVVIGDYAPTELATWFRTCSPATIFDNGQAVDNDEQGVPLRTCAHPRTRWSRLWPQIRHLG
jgi:Dolichyl-phosphate-mannose-protein mannosyltransferase